MNYKRIYYYFLYFLLLGGILAKVLGWLLLQHNIVSDVISEYMILLFLVLEVKVIHRRLNPGLKMLTHGTDGVLLEIPVRSAWRWVSLLIRLFLVIVLLIIAFGVATAERNPEYVLAIILVYIAGHLLFAQLRFLQQNPFRILITEEGIQSYVNRYFFAKWEEISSMGEKSHWLELHLIDRVDKEIDFEDVKCPREDIVSTLKAQAIIRGIRYVDHTDGY